MSKPIWNFSPGPAALPQEVLQQAQAEFLNWQNRGVSVLEVSHRSKAFLEMAEEAQQDLRDLLNIPQDYDIIFSTGGVTAHFAFIPMNFLQPHETAAYAITGTWSAKSVHEAQKQIQVNIATDSYQRSLLTIDPVSQWQIDPKAKYLHYITNETVDGLQFQQTPEVDLPLIVDMSSDILSKPIDIGQYAMVYAGAQKNIGPAGLVILIIHRDWLRTVRDNIPTVFNYEVQSKSESMVNTPTTFSWYLAALGFKWLKAQGGVSAIQKVNQQKAQWLYQTIDQSSLYFNQVDPQYRSTMNVIFDLADQELLARFLSEAENHGLMNLKGHVVRGGIRASIYNAMPLAGVMALVDFMKEFEKRA